MSQPVLISKLNSFALLVLFCATACGGSHQEISSVAPGEIVQVSPGDGTHPTVRKPFRRPVDDPATAEDESAYQPVGYFGTTTILVRIPAGQNLPLDVDTVDGQVRRIYMPKGGWSEMRRSSIDSRGFGSGTDARGRGWAFVGFADGHSEAEPAPQLGIPGLSPQPDASGQQDEAAQQEEEKQQQEMQQQQQDVEREETQRQQEADRQEQERRDQEQLEQSRQRE